MDTVKGLQKVGPCSLSKEFAHQLRAILDFEEIFLILVYEMTDNQMTSLKSARL